MTVRREAIARTYDGSKLVMELLQRFGWGPLLNLGYFRLFEAPLLLLGLGPFQRRLAHATIRLLDPKPGERIVDVCCGQGYTSARIAASGAEVLGLDLLPEHVQRARERYGGRPHLRFEVGDAIGLTVEGGSTTIEPESVDGILCLEAGFYFGPDGRKRFLESASRALKPGGRLVLADFTWVDEHPEDIEKLDPERLVRGLWEFEQFEPLARYRRIASEYGLVEERLLDWSRFVTARFQQVCNLLVFVGRWKLGRHALALYRGGGQHFQRAAGFTRAEWEEVRDVVAAHDSVRQRSRYHAMVFRKPGPGAPLTERPPVGHKLAHD